MKCSEDSNRHMLYGRDVRGGSGREEPHVVLTTVYTVH